MAWASSLIDANLIDLGGIRGTKFAKVLIPDSEIDTMPAGVTSQFLADAETYHEKYTDTAYSDYMIGGALEKIAPLPDNPVILDVGSGSGNSVISTLKLRPRSRVVATDVSPELLSILRRSALRQEQQSQVETVVLDLNRRWIKKDSVDLVIGSAILHHLFDPANFVTELSRCVKTGGSLIFFEPFEPGYAMLAMLYQQLIDAAASRQGVDTSLVHFFQGKIEQIASMNCMEKPPELYANVDDKWMFTRAYFERIAKRIGATRLQIHPLNGVDEPFSGQIRTALRLGLGRPEGALPKWGWDLVARLDRVLSPDCKTDMLLEGTVIFTM